MDFKYKTVAELNAMSEDEREKYLADKRTHEDDVRKKELDKAKDDAVEAAKKAAKTALDEHFKSVPEGVTKESFETFKTEINTMIENIGKAAGNKTVDTGENVIKALADKYEAFYEKGQSTEVVDEVNKSREKNDRAKFSVEHKAWADTNIHSVGQAGTTNVPSSTYQTLVTQVVGRYTKPRPVSRIMDFVDVQPLNAGSLTIFEDTTTGSFQVTPEGTLKPFVVYEEKDKSADAEIVTALWCTTTKLRRFYPGVANRMRQTFENLLGDTIPSLVLSFVKTNASALTPPTGLTFTNPTEYDAIVTSVAALKKAGYAPNIVGLSPVGYAKLITNKTTDGVLTLQNGQSIAIVGSTIVMGAYAIDVVEDPTLLDDEFIVGDVSVVHVGLDSEILYLETDGRIEGETLVKTGLQANVRTHELGKFLAIVIADGAKAGIVKDTFTNVITLITAV